LAADTAASTALLGPAVMTPDAVGEIVAQAIEEERFLVYSDSAHAALLSRCAQDIEGFLRLLQSPALSAEGAR
jgi:hypothetical protein